MKKLIIMGGIWIAFAASAHAQNGDGYWKRLQKTHPETTLEALQTSDPAVSQIPAGQADVDACRLHLAYLGETRAISKEVVQQMKEKGLKAGIIRRFRKEVLFKSENKEVWLPITASLADQLEIEVPKEEHVLLYTTVLKDNNLQDKQVVLLVEDYQVK